MCETIVAIGKMFMVTGESDKPRCESRYGAIEATCKTIGGLRLGILVHKSLRGRRITRIKDDRIFAFLSMVRRASFRMPRMLSCALA